MYFVSLKQSRCRVFYICTIIFFIVTVSSCDNSSDETPELIIVNPAAQPETQVVNEINTAAYVYHAENGNRWVKGQGQLPTSNTIDIELPALPKWLVAAPLGQQSVWAAVLSDGQVKAYQVSSQGYDEVEISPSQLQTVTPPVLVVDKTGAVKLANIFSQDASPYSSAVVIDKTQGTRAYVASNGDIVLKTKEDEQRLAVQAVNYTRLLIDDGQRILALTQPTLSYDHQVLGSAHENAAAITLIETTPEFRKINDIEIASPDIIEGNALIWEDINNDGQREIIVTLSNQQQGARIVIFDESGIELSSSTAIGQSYRWRHQIAVAPFQSADQLSLVSVRKPHLTASVEYFNLADGSMAITDKALGYTSHLQISLNIDMGLVGDFDGDGKIEFMLVEQNGAQRLGAIEYHADDIKLDWTLALDDAITTNIAATTLLNGTIVLGVGQRNKQLRIWSP